MDLKSINELNDNDAGEVFRRCCGSNAWVEEMIRARPFASDEALSQQADRSFKDLTRADWMEAFAAHPKIGDITSLKKKYAVTQKWAENEQAGAQGISDEVAKDLADRNEEYFQKFGYIFIVCATGKSAQEMLTMLKQRLNNDAETELPIAAEEQKKITHLRLGKL
ncbi:MAG: 2-oxo-4-hydroxy-4-carboxy-5-ureidoimidazoline decarboxylase [Cyanobacteria bacterium SZAS-4]|nr:2-oxo-4-hydroxy-4-carboxy-5-ureidoimidazoline decarboxylase [Cyanobacteria bacterium SZAS-4]